MEKYVKGPAGIEYFVYSKPILMSKTDILSTFTEGGALICCEDKRSGNLKVGAHIKYIEDWNEVDYCRAINELGYDAKPEFILLLHPVKRICLNLEKPAVLSAEKFYKDEKNEYFYIAGTCRNKYVVTDKDIIFLIKEDPKHDDLLFYGYTSMVLSGDYKRIIEEKDIQQLSYADYLVRQRLYFLLNRESRVEMNNDRFEYERKDFMDKNMKLPPLAKEIRAWLAETDFNSFADAIKERVKGQENVAIILINIYNYLECVAYGKKHNNNMLLAAPSGCGKTETFRAVRDYFEEKIPGLIVYQMDMTSVTEEGYRGKNTSSIVEPLLKKCRDCNGIGIIFMDEFDKKLIPSYSGFGTNVNAAIQYQILTLIEGRTINDEKGSNSIDTNNTLFIGLGAFNSCRKKNEIVEKHIGFGEINVPVKDHYDFITREDMIDIGASYELLGRFSTIVNYHKLTDKCINEIINMMVDRVGARFGCKISISKKMRERLHESANSEYGCRIMESMIKDEATAGYLKLKKKGLNSSEYLIKIDGPGEVRCQKRSTKSDPAIETITTDTDCDKTLEQNLAV